MAFLGELIKKLGFTGRSESVLGVDIGTSSIKVVQLRKEQERAILETYGEVALGPYGKVGVGQAVSLSAEVIASALKDVIKEANAKAISAVAAIPLKSSFVTLIEVPIIEGRNPADIIELEARRYIPLAISEVEMDWWILPDTGNEEEKDAKKRKFAKVLLVAIHKDVIGKYNSIMSASGIGAKTLEVESFSTSRSSVWASSTREGGAVVIIDLGASSVKATILDWGLVMSTHSISKGSQDLTRALANSLSVDFNRAEEMKRKIGLSPLPEHKEMVSVLTPVLEYVFFEIKSFLKDYQQKSRRTVGRAVLTGGGSLLNGLVDFAVKQLSMEVSLADPFAKVEYPAFLGETLKSTGASFSVAIGLALRGLQ